MHALEASLELHGKETNEEMQPLHKQMEDQLCITKRDILRAINVSSFFQNPHAVFKNTNVK